jgi:hypothetical protein
MILQPCSGGEWRVARAFPYYPAAGVARLHTYFDLLRLGRINTWPNVRVVRQLPGTATVDGDNGLGLVVGPRANRLAMDKACAVGSGWRQRPQHEPLLQRISYVPNHPTRGRTRSPRPGSWASRCWGRGVPPARST